MTDRLVRRADAVARFLRNGPAAATVAARHIVRSSEHASSVPQPWLAGASYAAALTALRAGDLTEALDAAADAGRPGRALAHLIEGDLAVLDPPLVAGRCPRLASRADSGRARSTVLHLVTNALPETNAGYSVRTQGIARAQVRAGHAVHVATRVGYPVTRGHLSASPEVTVQGIAHHRLLPGRLPFRADAALRLDIEMTARLVEQHRPDVLHAHTNHVNGQVALALRSRFGLPVVYEVRGLLEETWRSRAVGRHAADSDFYRLNRAAESQVMRAADAVVTLSESLREQVVARGVPSERVHVVPNCVDDEWLGEIPRPPARPFTVGTVGTLNAYEGIEVLVDAVALLRSVGADVRLRVVGDGPARAGLEKRAVERGIADATTFTGRVSHDVVRDEHLALDAFCLPRHDLPVTRLVPPLKPVEAMALRLPVVASDLAPLRELLDDGRGLLVPPGDASPLAVAIEKLTDPGIRRVIGQAGHEFVAATRTWSGAARSYQQIYTHLKEKDDDR